jgi:FkbM family methyltransferase
MSDPFVSYAQNFEDVMLWRALKHVDSGFYVDVGAYSPSDDSITRAFYERGWQGINIEPNPDLLSRFIVERPRDVNLGVAAGDQAGLATMYLVSNAGLSTLDAGEADLRAREGYEVTTGTAEVSTLATILRDHVPPHREVNFLKIDVEGWERRVLFGNDWRTKRPWIVVVEATRPMTAEPSHAEWESILTDAAYTCVYRDGVNRFYLADEHRELASGFDVPPNWFDGFIRASEYMAVNALVAAERRAASAEQRAASAVAELTMIQTSRSWRLTRPLRTLAARVRTARSLTRHDTD